MKMTTSTYILWLSFEKDPVLARVPPEFSPYLSKRSTIAYLSSQKLILIIKGAQAYKISQVVLLFKC